MTTQISHPAVVIAALLFLAVATILAVTLFVHPDIYPALHTYGVSAGTNTHYCSLEIIRWAPRFSCETAS